MITKMITQTINLHEVNVFTEFFLGVSILYLIIHCLLVSVDDKNGFPLLQASLINLSTLTILMSCSLLWNDSLTTLCYISFSNSVVNDYLGFISKFIIGISSAISLTLIKHYLTTQKINSFEYVLIILFAVLGLFLLCSSNDFITAYLAIELQSLSFYVLSAFKKKSSHSVESGLKYFILGSFSSGLFLFGASLIYGSLGTLNFIEIQNMHVFQNVYGQAEWINSKGLYNLNYQLLLDTSCFAAVGLIFVLVSLFFKLALAPFHLWAPDIYENSPNSSAFFFAVVPKISIFVILIRISYHVLLSDLIWSETIISSIGVISVLVGSLGGLEQRKFKSLLAYSSISHTGYMLIAFVSESFEGFQMLFCYLIIYTGSGLCIWSVFMLLRLKKINNGKQNKDLTDFVLLKKSNKTLAAVLTVALFSIAGIPPMIGFLAKLNIFLVAVSKGLYFISFVSIMFSVFSTFYYLRVIKILYFEPRVVGKLYYPIITQNIGVIVVLNYFFLFTFINPSLLYLLTHKMSLLFTL